MPKRGEVWWVNLDPAIGSEIKKSRPCLVMTSDIVNARRRTVVVVPLSSSPQAAPPLLVPISGLGRQAVAVIDQIRAVDKQRFSGVMGRVSAREFAAVEEALREVLEL